MTNWIAFLVFILATAHSGPGQLRALQQLPASNNSITKTTEARTLLDQAKAAALKISADSKRQFLLVEIGIAEAKAGDLDGAVETANQVGPFGTEILDAIGEQLANSNDLPRAKSLGLKLKEGRASALISSMVRSQAKKGKIDEAILTARQIQFLEVRSYALQDIALQQAARGDDVGARQTLALARAAHRKGLYEAADVEMMIVMGQLSQGNTQAARATINSWKSAVRRQGAMIGGTEALLHRGDKTAAAALLQDALRTLPAGQDYDFIRYMAIPIQVKLGQKDRAMQAAAAFSPELRANGYSAVAVTSAEAKDMAGVNTALEQMQAAAGANGEKKEPSDFVRKLMIVNVTAALIDNGQFEAASGWLTAVAKDLDEISEMFIEPTSQMQQVFILAHQGRFDDARSLALKIRSGDDDEVQRGNGLRITALLQTNKNGLAASKPWASALADTEDRAYALLGIAQALLGIDKVKLGYSAIQVH